MSADIKQLAARIENRADDLYPHDIWAPLEDADWVNVREAVEAAGFTLDRISADLIRRGIRTAAFDLRDGYLDDEEQA